MVIHRKSVNDSSYPQLWSSEGKIIFSRRLFRKEKCGEKPIESHKLIRRKGDETTIFWKRTVGSRPRFSSPVQTMLVEQ